MIKNSTLFYLLNNLEESENYVIQADDFFNEERNDSINDYFNLIMQDVNDKVLESILNYSKTSIA